MIYSFFCVMLDKTYSFFSINNIWEWLDFWHELITTSHMTATEQRETILLRQRNFFFFWRMRVLRAFSKFIIFFYLLLFRRKICFFIQNYFQSKREKYVLAYASAWENQHPYALTTMCKRRVLEHLREQVLGSAIKYIRMMY